MIALEAALDVNSQFEPLARWRWTELLVIAAFCFCSFFDFSRSLIKSLRDIARKNISLSVTAR